MLGKPEGCVQVTACGEKFISLKMEEYHCAFCFTFNLYWKWTSVLLCISLESSICINSKESGPQCFYILRGVYSCIIKGFGNGEGEGRGKKRKFMEFTE